MRRYKTDQPGLFDGPGAAVEVTLDAMERSIDHADGDWRETALDCVHALALRQQELTTDAVHKLLATKAVDTHNWSAIGPVMVRAKAEGWIEKTGNIRRSRRVVGHGNLQMVWRSLICTNGSAQ